MPTQPENTCHVVIVAGEGPDDDGIAHGGMRVRFFWHHPQVDRASYEEIGGELHRLLVRLDDRLPSKDITLIAEFTDANELGLALEYMADVLSEDEQPLTPDERADLLRLVARMQMGDRVPKALRFCPEK